MRTFDVLAWSDTEWCVIVREADRVGWEVYAPGLDFDAAVEVAGALNAAEAAPQQAAR